MIFSRTYFIPSAVTFSIRVWFAVQNLIFVHPCKKVYRRSSKSNFFEGSGSFFFPNLKQRAQHAFSVNYIPSIIEKKNLAVVWLQCVSSSAWAGEAQFDYRSDFFLFRLTSVTLSIDISWNTLPVHPWDYLACRANALHEYEAIKPQRPEPGYIYIVRKLSLSSPLLTVGGCPLCCLSKLTTGCAQLSFPKPSRLYSS